MDFDQASIKARMEASLRAKSEWADLLFFGTNQRLINLVSETMAEQARYNEYLTRETKWSIGRNISSLLAQSRVLQYVARRKTGATGTVRVSAVETFDAPPAKTIVIPKYTVFSTALGVKLSTYETNNLTTNYLDVNVIQGEPKTYSTIALGNVNEVVEVDNDSIENTFSELLINDVLWTLVDDLRSYGPTEEVYTLVNLPNFTGIQLQFGDDLNGKKLITGDTVVFKYLETLGSTGNITQTGLVTEVESTIYDIDSAQVDLYVNNFDQLVGGDAVENIEDLRVNAPKVFFAGQRAVSRADYEAILSQNVNVLKSTVWGAYEINDDADTPGTYIGDNENFVYTAIVSTALDNISEATQEEIRASLNAYKSPTDVVSFEDVDFIKLIFTTDVFVSDRSLVLSEVKSRVLAAIEERYSVTTMAFNENVYESDYQAYIDNLEGVEYHDTDIDLVTEWLFTSVQYESGTTLYLPAVTPSTISIYVKHNTQDDDSWLLVATDDGVGGFDDSATSFTLELVTSAVNYSTGVISITISAGLPLVAFDGSDYEDYDIRAEYQINESNLVLQGRQQIFDFDRADVTIQYR